jgi:hypothetical protein
MPNIKTGDKIKCVFGGHAHNGLFKDGQLTFGKIYEVIDIISWYDGILVRIELDNGVVDKVYMTYNDVVWFEKVENDIDFLNLLKGY